MMIDMAKLNKIHAEMKRDKQSTRTVDGIKITITEATTPDVNVGMWLKY
jgi:hypothetical protein